jgi:NitT/TauT family transport system substrate-binding protein
MKTTIKILSLILCLCLVLPFAACGNNDVSSTGSEPDEYVGIDMNVACMTGPTGVGMAKLMAQDAENKTNNNYTFTVAADATEINAKFTKGEINIASVPTNVAATLYNKTGGKVRILAVNTYGVLSVLEKGDSISSINDLRGKTIYATGKGQNPEYILNYILQKNGIDPNKDLTINFVSGQDLIAKLVSGEAEIAVAPEPAATTAISKNTALRRALSINDEWSKVSDTKLMMGCVIALESYVTQNPTAVEKFLEEYKASIEYATTNVDEVATYCATYKITASEGIAKKAIPNCNLCFVTGQEMKTNVNGYLNVLFTANANSIGGAMPSDNFYYNPS